MRDVRRKIGHLGRVSYEVVGCFVRGACERSFAAQQLEQQDPDAPPVSTETVVISTQSLGVTTALT
jgi:hypothetical protein